MHDLGTGNLRPILLRCKKTQPAKYRQPSQKEIPLDDESSQFSKKTRIIVMIVAALAIAAIHIIYIRPRYGDSIPIILFQFFPLYFLWRILFGAKKEPPKKAPEKPLSKKARKNIRREQERQQAR